MENNFSDAQSTSVEEANKNIEFPMGQRASRLAIINSSSSIDLNTNQNNTSGSVVPINEPRSNSSSSSSNRIPIPLPSATINVQIQESPTATGTTATAGAGAAFVASSNTQLSDSDSSSLASLSDNTLQNRQIIIKIQLAAKMQNGSDQQEISGEPMSGMASPVAGALNRNSFDSVTENNSPQFVNCTWKGNLIYANEPMSLSTSSAAGGVTNSNNNTDKNSNIAADVQYRMNSTMATQDEWDRQNAIGVLQEYFDSQNQAISANTSGGVYLGNTAIERSNSISTDTIGCLNGKRKSKSSSRPTSASGLSGRCRDAIRRMLEPSSSKSSSKVKEQTTKKHSENSVVSTPKSCTRLSSPLPSTSTQVHLAQRNSRTAPATATTTTTTTAPTTSSSNNIIPISIATMGAPTNSNNTVNTGNQLSAAIWTPSRNDLIIPISSPPQFVVVQCPPTSVVTLGRIDDNAIRLTSTEIGQNGVGGNMNNALMNNNNSGVSVNGAGREVVANATVKTMHNGQIVHSQIDFVHWLVPDLDKITNSSFYWGKIDRFEAERLLEGKPEGTFLLRDSAQEEYLFSVTFRKYGRSLHARIEQSGHKFGFDCHDPLVYSAPTVTELLLHYKDPAVVMFFEPMLTIPLHRKTTFSLQALARAAIVSHTTYDGINELGLPSRLKSFLKEYHYKQKLRVKPLDEPFYSCT